MAFVGLNTLRAHLTEVKKSTEVTTQKILHLLLCQLIRFPVTAAHLWRFIQRYAQHIRCQRLQTEAVTYWSLPKRNTSVMMYLQMTQVVSSNSKSTVIFFLLLSQGKVTQVDRARQRQAVVTRQPLSVFVATNSDFQDVGVSEYFH